jgi:hypothetical protein
MMGIPVVIEVVKDGLVRQVAQELILRHSYCWIF